MLSKQTVLQKLKKVIDPEIGISIVDLGLIYDVKINKDKVNITATLTSPMCPIGAVIIKDIENAVMSIKEVEDIKVTISFDPPWNKDMISQKAKKELGII